MSNRVWFFLCGVLVLACGAACLSAQPPFVEGEVVVRLAAPPPPGGADPSAPKSASPADLQRGRAPVPAVFGPLVGRATGALLSAKPVAPGVQGRAVRMQGATPAETASGTTLYVLRFADPADVPALCRDVGRLPGVVCAEPNYLGTVSYAPADPYYAGNQKPMLDRLGLEAAWDVQQGGDASLVVAVIDSGIDTTHDDLEDLVHPASENFIDPANGIYDDLGHGTRVAGIIAAEANNGAGIAGIAFGVQVLSLDVVNAVGSVTSANVIAALDQARAEGAHVINLSLSIFGRSTLLEQACDAAAQTAVLVASAGNEGRGDRPVYPASYDSVLGVGATERLSDVRASYSNYNGTDSSLVDLVAPGSNVFTTIPGSVYDGLFTSGTSFAAPVVSGIAALLRSRYPEQSPAGIVYQLQATAVPLGAWAGSGRLDAEAALETALLPGLSIASIAVDDATTIYAGNDVDGAWDQGETVDLILMLANAAGDAVDVTGTLTKTDPAVTVVDGVGGWGSIASGVAKAATDAVRVTAAAEATAHEATLSLSLSSNGGAYTTVLAPRPRIDNVQPISGVKSNQTFTSDKTYHVTGNLSLRGNTTIQPGTVFKVDPGIDVRADSTCNLSAVGTAEKPILFTSARPLGAGLSAPGNIGPRNEAVNLGSYQAVRYVSVSTGVDTPSGGTSGNPWASIQYALDQITDAGASKKYAVLVAEGTYTGTGNQVVTMKQYVDLYGGFEAAGWRRDIELHVSAVDGQNARRGASGDNNARLDGFTIKRGHVSSGNGGGVYCYNSSSPTISNCRITGNSAGESGGGVYCSLSSPTIINCMIMANSAGNSGGGVHCYASSSPTIRNSVIIRNSASHGGGVYCTNSSPTISDCVINENFTSNEGGGIFCHLSSSPTISNSVIMGNSASNEGGGVYCVHSSSPAISKCAISGNSATTSGGGLYCNASSAPTISNCMISGNSASVWWGGGVYCDSSSPTISNCVISGNSGRGVYCIYSSSPTIRNCAIRQNSSVQVYGVPPMGVRYSNVEGGWGIPTDYNIDADPRFLGLTTWGMVTALTYDSTSGLSTCAVDRALQATDCLKGQVVRVGTRYYFLLSNTVDALVLLGDATEGGTVRGPQPWLIYDYHLRSDSPNLGAGVGPGADPSIPTTDVDGDTRSGATCDIGIDEYNAATAPQIAYWGRLWVTSAASSANVQHVIVENGEGMLNDLAATSVAICTFRSNNGNGFQSSAGSSTLANCTAEFNADAGFLDNTQQRPLVNCVASYNGEQGLVGAALTDCTAYGNGAAALTGTTATDCTAEWNAGDGFTLSGAALRCLAWDNRGKGLVNTGGNVTDCQSWRNDGVGILKTGSGTVSGSTAGQNQGGGIDTTSATVSGCVVEGNTGIGVKGSGSSSLQNSTVSSNDGFAVSGVTSVSSSVITDCTPGITGASTVTGAYVAGNTGNGIAGGTISNSAVLGNTGNGIHGLVALSNSWVLRNGGIGVNATSGAPPVGTSTMRDNGGVGTLNVLSLTSCNLWDNGGYEAEDTDPGSDDRDFDNCYWGPENTAELGDYPEWENMSFLHDALDSPPSGNHVMDVWPYEDLPVADAPSSAAPAVLLEVTPNLDNAVEAGLEPFTLVFSEAMNTAVAPVVTFDATLPYTAHVVSPNPGWTDATTWEGVYAVDTVVGSGRNTIRVSGATAADGFTIPDDTFHQFDIDVDAEPGVTNGRIVDTYPNGLRIAWDPSPTAVKFELYRVEGPDQGDPSQEPLAYGKPFHTVWAPSTEYTNLGLWGGTLYFYQVKETDASGNTSDLDNPFQGYTGGAVVYVDDDGPYNGINRFNTIADGVAAVPSGGTVVVNEGTYPEQVTVTKPLTLMGSGSAIMNGSGLGAEPGLLVANTGVTIAYLRIQNYQTGIRVGVAGHATIHHCNFINNTVYAVENLNTSLEVKAENCWWGKATGP